MGVDIVRRAVEEPLRMISKNAGVEAVVVQGEAQDGSYGYNAATAACGDMFEFGLIDPTRSFVTHAMRRRCRSNDHDRGSHCR